MKGRRGVKALSVHVESAFPPERRQHGPVELAMDRSTDPPRPMVVPGETGEIGQPYYAPGLLAAMERSGKIDRPTRVAGDRFSRDFHAAGHGSLRAADLARVIVDGGRRAGDLDDRAENAAGRVWAALVAVGGRSTFAGSCLWHVVGLEMPLSRWALERAINGRRVSNEAASGILRCALDSLRAHYDVVDGSSKRRVYTIRSERYETA